MYDIVWDKETGGISLTENKAAGISGTIRPVFFEELDILGCYRHWSYPKVEGPLLWAIGRRYFYRGQLVAEAKGGRFFELPHIKIYKKGLNLQPVSLKLMLDKNRLLLEGLIYRALEFIYNIHLKYQKRVNITAVAFSGGKDSLVLLDLIQRALMPSEFVVVFSDTTMEVSATYEAVERAKQRWNNLTFHTARSAKPATTTWREFGPPSRIHRWCCTVHKSAPTLLLLRELVGKPSVKALIYDGIRREESQPRTGYLPVSEGAKHITQTNASPLLEWNAGEIFLYLFDRNILFNRAYRYGFVRVGCAVCPLASKWWNSISWVVFKKDIEVFIKILREYAKAKGIKKEEVAEFIKERSWMGRAGGRGMVNGGTKVLENDEGSTSIFFIRTPKENWLEWAKTLGTIVRESTERGWIENSGPPYPFRVQRYDQGLEIKIGNLDKADRYFKSRLQAVANKAAYCVHCRGCEVECPTGALQIADNVSINEKDCYQCGNCLTFIKKGCLAAKSLAVSKGGVNVKGLNRYQHFGMRKIWLDEYFKDPENWWHKNELGNRQFEAMRVWLRDSNPTGNP